MKPAVKFFAVGAMVLTLSANAIERFPAPLVVALTHADLYETTEGDAIKYPMVKSITKNGRRITHKPTSFVLVQDTGIRCIKAPCPSTKRSTFRIENVERLNRVTNRYTAVEVVAPTKLIGPMARVLEVVESVGTEDEGDDLLEVTLRTFGQERTFEGYASPVYSIQ